MKNLNNAYAPSTDDIIDHCKTLHTEDDILNYLSEVASNDFQCPDKCDQWAMEFYEDNYQEINQDYEIVSGDYDSYRNPVDPWVKYDQLREFDKDRE